MTTTPAAVSAPRLAFVDAMRGVAALSVVVYHGYKELLLPYAQAPLAQPLDFAFRQGFAGVEIFFTISGFVIALSLRDRDMSAGLVGRFLLRRSLRLDPPYWAVIALAIAVAAAVHFVDAPDAPLALPTAHAVAAHAFYLEYFLQEPPILGVFWTLCLELQFYVVFIVVLAIVARAGGREHLERNAMIVFVPLFAASIAAKVADPPYLVAASFLPFWFYFFAGVLACWAPERVHRGFLFAAVVVMAAMFAHAPKGDLFFGALAPLGFFLAKERGLLSKTGGRALQGLGAISYSLYLTHMIASQLALRAVSAWFDAPYAPLPFAVLLACAVAAPIPFAIGFHVVVERPSHGWSRRIRL